MKAFGARLAAGFGIIVLGAVMAAQGQKQQELAENSNWNTSDIPDGKSPQPISAGDLLPTVLGTTTEVASEDTTAPATLTDERDSAQAIRLVQHTEPLGAMSLPQQSPATKESVPGGPAMPMRLPNFDDAPEPQPVSTDSNPTVPSVGIGMTGSALQPSEPPASAPSTMSPVRFSDSPVKAFSNNVDDPSIVHGEPPANGLRATPSPLRAEFDNATPSEGLSALPIDGSGMPVAPDFPESAPGLTSGPSVTDSRNPLAGNPAAMLSPVVPQPEIASTPTTNPAMVASPRNSTIKFAADAAPLLPSQDGQEFNMATESQPSAGDFVAGPQGSTNLTIKATDGASGFAQPVGGVDGQGYAQSAGGFSVPADYNMPGSAGSPGSASPFPGNQGPGNQGSGMTAQALPNLPAPSAIQPSAPSAAPNGYSAPARTAALPPGQTGVFSGVGHKLPNGSLASDRPLPAGPTMASPGERNLDGPQSPSILIQKIAPPEVKVGKPATFKIQVKNVGGSTALDVVVKDRVPTGMEIVDATPRPDPKFQPELVWLLGDMEPNQEHTITLQLTPLQEGTLGSVARVTFNAAASVRTTSTRPALKIIQSAPEKVLIGQQLEIELEVSNPGSGEATGVVLQEDVPAGLKHPQGRELDNLIGTLRPGEIRRQVLSMQAVQAGIVQNTIRVKGDDGLEANHTVAVEIIAPDLQVALSGPSKRYLERQATFHLEIANVGTADATNVDISVQLDRGFTFVSTDFEGQYDSSRHAVFWSLPSLPVGESGRVPLTLLPVEEGNRVLQTVATADMNIRANSERQVAVDSLAELTFSINDSADPVEIGGESIYEIRVTNSGSRDDTNVRVQVALPPGIQLAQQQGDFQQVGQGLIEFAPRALLKANDEVIYRLKTLGRAPGRHKVKAIVTSDQSNVPVTKEESIMVYSDQ